jgi:hypothetical protein
MAARLAWAPCYSLGNLDMGVRSVDLRRLSWAHVLLCAAIVLHLLMLSSIFTGYMNGLFYSTDRARRALDFFGIYEAGARAFDGTSVYRAEHGLLHAPYLSPYRYVPAFAYGAGGPLSLLRPWHAYWAWVSINEVLLLLNAYVTYRVVGRGTWGLVTIAMWLSFTPFYIELWLGQFSFLVATAMLFMGIGCARLAHVTGGIGWLGTLSTKGSGILLTPVFLRARWLGAVAAGIAVCAVNGLYFLWRPHDLRFFLDTNASSVPILRERTYWPPNEGLYAFVQNTYFAIYTNASHSPRPLAAILAIVILTPSLFVTMTSRKPDLLLLFAIWSCTIFLFYNWVAEFHYVMMLPVLALLVGLRPRMRLAALAVFVPLALPTPYWLFTHVWNTGPIPQAGFTDPIQNAWPRWGVVVYHAWKPLPVLALWAYLLAEQCRDGVALNNLRRPWQALGLSAAEG